MLTLEQVSDLLLVTNAPALPDYETIQHDLKSHKADAISKGDQALAKSIWCFEHTIEVQTLFQKAYAQLREGSYYEGWCALEQVELAIRRLLPHFEHHWDDYWLRFIHEKVPMLQSLFPYKIFISPEILEIEKECNICGLKISIRNPCGHRVGEIYDGEYCCRIVTKCEFLSISMVEDPVQRYSVPFVADPKTGESNDQYNYSTVEYLVKRWPTPFHDWAAEWTTALHPKELFGQLGRNDKCPCDSGKKYKKCCLHRQGILRPHCQFSFKYAIPRELQEVELSY